MLIKLITIILDALFIIDGVTVSILSSEKIYISNAYIFLLKIQ